MRKAASLGFGVAKPWGDCDRYDVLVHTGKIFRRMQVKSVWAKTPRRNYYRIHTTNRIGIPYTADEIDFLVGYIFPEDLWYIFPAPVMRGLKCVCLSPGSKRSRYEQYREAWKLIEPASSEAGAVPCLESDASAEGESTLCV